MLERDAGSGPRAERPRTAIDPEAWAAETRPPAGLVIWLTGRPRSGKSTLARAIAARLRAGGTCACVLDGDDLRGALVPSPGYDEAARAAVYATLIGLALALAREPIAVLVPATTHARSVRDHARVAARGRYLEVWVAAGEAMCRARDDAGLYRAFDESRAPTLPGLGVAYEVPVRPEFIASGGQDDEALDVIARRARALLRADRRDA
jgi:adenylylsulfate kinase